MKIIKRIFSILLTLILSILALNNVSAEATGTITVENTTDGKYYSIYRIFDLTLKGEGKNAQVAYTINEEWEDFFNDKGAKYIKETNTKKLNQVIINNQIYYIDITEENIVEFTQVALTYAGLKTPVDRQKGTGTNLIFSGDKIALGYYLVYPEGATEKNENSKGTICSITSTVPSTTVKIKATYPTITKTVEDQNLDVGQYAEFTITGIVPDTTGFTTYTYQINDTMSNGLLFNEEIADLVVTINNNKIDINENMTLTYTDNGFILTFEMTEYQNNIGDKIIITYKAKVTESAISKNDITNKVTLTYSNDPKNSENKDTTPEIKVPIYTSAVKVTKVDGADKTTPLAGASFVLKKYVVTEVEDEESVTTTYYYKVTGSDENMLVTWVTNIEEATVLTTPSDGIITFKGIENGTYYLEETIAPEGFNKLTTDYEVTVNPESDTIVAVTKETIVENNAGSLLPETGGIGTTLFIVIGSLLALTSAIIYITNKRIEKEM